MTPEKIQTLIEQGIQGARVICNGDDGTHFQAIVISDSFDGLSRVKRQQAVYQTLGNAFSEGLHALELKTLTLAEWEQQNG